MRFKVSLKKKKPTATGAEPKAVQLSDSSRKAIFSYVSVKRNIFSRALRSKNFLLVIVFIVVSALLLAAIQYNKNIQRQKQIDRFGVCSLPENSEFRDGVLAVYNNTASSTLESLVKEIQELPKFENDPNCLHPIVSHYVFTSDPSNAKKEFDRLEAALKSGKRLDYRYLQYRSIESFRKSIVHLQMVSENSRANNTINTLKAPGD